MQNMKFGMQNIKDVAKNMKLIMQDLKDIAKNVVPGSNLWEPSRGQYKINYKPL